MATLTDWTHRYPDHRESIAGQQLDPDGLLADERHVESFDLIMALCRHLMTAILVGHPAPIVAEMDARMRSPQVGDLVVEWTALNHRLDFDRRVKGFGYLLAIREEWFDSAAEWAAFEVDDPECATESNRATDTAWYVQYGPNPTDVCRWTNCQFVVVLADPDLFRS